MARYSKLLRKPKKAPIRTRTVITPQLKLNILKDFHITHMTITSICVQYSCCYETVRKIIDSTEYKVEDFKPFIPGDLHKRADLPPQERQKLLTSDVTRVIESILALMFYRLQQELILLQSSGDNAPTISFKDLTRFFAAVAPYGLLKPDGKGINEENKKFDYKTFVLPKSMQLNKTPTS